METIGTSREFALASMGADYQTLAIGFVVLAVAAAGLILLRRARRMRFDPARTAAVS